MSVDPLSENRPARVPGRVGNDGRIPLLLSSRETKRRLAIMAAVGACLLVAAAGWWSRARRGVRREPGLSVLLITVDTLRADALGAYGSRSALTPWMDRLAASGVLFEDAHAHNVVTLPFPRQHALRPAPPSTTA